MTDPFRLVLGSHNQKKSKELQLLLRGLPINVATLADYANALDVDETGKTFRENAILKAVSQAKHLNEWVIGEDSGLSVSGLDGRPGIFSARYAGEHGNDLLNNEKLTGEVSAIPEDQRTAWYTCHIALANPDGHVHIDVQATCHGRIIEHPRGAGGFGYDPHFELVEYRQTFAELGDTVKSVLSHRAKAMRLFLEEFKALLNRHPS